MLLKIYYYGHPVLRKRCEPISEITDEIRKLASDMIETMDKNDGIGLAAPQVGRSIRMFVLRNYIFTEEGHWTVSEPKVYINPKLSSPGTEMLSDTEGCLSLPGLRLHVLRPDKITVEAMDLDGKIFVEELEGYNARVRMHENDHINGVLFVDRIDVNARKKIDPLLKEMKKKYNP
ncbi:MAG: peptide deformylase [Verrucomicrobia bacterium]|nr:peptide deformylase [Verrucomicrobiota bacterium]